MIKKHTQEHRLGLRTAAVFFVFFLFTAGQAWSEQGYDAFLATMQARQSQLDELLKSQNHCLGEQLDGLLKINTNCSAEARRLADDENRDREELHRLMAEQVGRSMTAEKIGEDRAKKYVDSYIQGVLREVQVPRTGETTWWDGYSPDPRKTAVSRVLALRYAHIYKRPDADSPVTRDNVQQYEAFGVLDSTEDKTGERWYQVTEEYIPKIKPRSWSPKPIGWIAENQIIPWQRALVMRFTNSYHRDLSLLFEKSEPVVNLMRETPGVRKQELRRIHKQFENGRGGASDVVAVEPRVGAGQERMIMYPILNFKDDLRIDNKAVRLLEVAARTRNGTSGTGASGNPVAIDIIFVMDTTNSMRPYLKNVLSATEEFARAHKDDDGLRFGFIGYQDKDPQFSYPTKEFTHRTLPASQFIHALAEVQARDYPVRGDDIPEAVFEGINTALDSNQWRDKAIKIIFLVGDAPGRPENFLNAEILHDKALTRDIRVFAFQLKNSSISKNWDRVSRKQYAELSSFSEGIRGTAQVQNYLRTVDAGAAQFRQVVSEEFLKAQQALNDIRNIVDKGNELPTTASGSLNELIFQQATLLYADNSLPDQDITGWICDKVLTNPDKVALTPMILLTENELAELTARVEELKKIGVKALRAEGGTTRDFFDLVAQNTKFTMVDPTAVNFRDVFSVPLGISELPYRSDIMMKDRSDFDSPDRVQRFIRSMNNKLRHYEDLKRKRLNENVWKKLSAGAQDRDRVVGVELDQLP